MGVVWLARHRGLGAEVAVKVLTAGRARDVEYAQAFADEVRAVAALDHPRIVHVHDHGSVDAAAEQASEGTLREHSPWLAMDLVAGGTLGERAQQAALSWTQQRGVLLALLDALAHAHSRGLVHRDLKPANVLLANAADPAGSLQLTDFGLAQAGEERASPGHTELAAGTPQYMSPEQFEGHWRDYGPWTDLYALGCVAFKLASGTQPFQGESMFTLAFAHMEGRREAFRPRIAVPEGFEDWLDRMMRRAPGERFQRAADAAWALRQLDPVTSTDEPAPLVDDEDLPTLVGLNPVTDTHLMSERTLVQAAPRMAVPPPLARPEDRVTDYPPQPTDWRPADRARQAGLPGAGLGLFGLRTVPLVDRERERDLLWAALAEVRKVGSMRMALLRGVAGTGKSRLAAWMAQRADEVGSAMVLTARHSPQGGPGDGLGPMLRRFLRARGLDREGLRERTGHLLTAEGELNDYEQLGLTQLMAPTDVVGDEAPFTFSGPAERHGLLRRFITRVAAGRPLVLWLDDVQWGADALDFVRRLLGSQTLAPAPVLVLATVRDDLLVPGSEEARLLDELTAAAEVRSLPIEPLGPDDHRDLVARLLGLRGDLAQRVADRTDGNPLFAVQLVGDWVDRGVLEPTLQGFVLRAGEEGVLPDGIQQVWMQRLDTALAGLHPDARAALQVAAALGGEVDRAEWELACVEAGLAVPPGLVDRLVGAGLVHAQRGGWAFDHGLLRESLAEESRGAGTWRHWHAACVAMLAPSTARGAHARRAGHQDVCDPPAAADSWLEAAYEAILGAEYAQAEDLIRRGEATLRSLAVPDSDPRWGRFAHRRLTVMRHQVRLAEARAFAESWLAVARRHRWPALEARFLGDLGDIFHRTGDLDEAERVVDAAEVLHLQQGSERDAVACRRVRANIQRIRGNLPAARALLVDLRRWYQQHDNALQAANTARDLAILEVADGQPGRAAELVAEARQIYDRVGFRMGVVRCLNTQGTALMVQGRLPDAIAALNEALELDRRVKTGLGAMICVNLALAQLRVGAFADAEAAMAPHREPALAGGDPLFELVYRLAGLAAALGQRPVPGWEAELERAVELIDQIGISDGDVAWPLEIAGRQAALRGQPEASRALLELALAQWSAVGDAAGVGRLRG